MKNAWVVLLALCLGCSGGFSVKNAAKTNILRTTMNTNPTTLDPAIVQDIDTQGIIDNVFEGLVQWDANNTLQPLLADKWSLSPDGKTYTFHIRRGVKFHNGREVTPEDVQYSLERSCNPDLNSPTAANYLGDIVGAKERFARKADHVAGIEHDSENVTIHLDKPRPYFLGKLTYPCAFIVAKVGAGPGKEISKIEQMIGTGPFKADSFLPDQQLTLSAFNDYHGGRPKLERIEEIVMKDSQTRIDKFRAGEVEMAGVARQDALPLSKDVKLGNEVQFEARPAVAYVAMSKNGYPPFADARVRRAIAMAVDKRNIVEVLLGGSNPLAEGILPPGIAGHRDRPNGLPYDPKAAANLLAEAGYPGGKGLPALELVIRDQTPDTRIVAEAIASQIGANLGVKVTLKTMEWRSLLESRNHNKLGFFILSWYADYLDPQNFLSTLLTTSGSANHFGYSNPEVDKLCGEADSELDQTKRIVLYDKAEDMILNDAPWLPLYYVRDAELVSPKVTGLEQNLLGHMPYTKVEVK